MTTNSKVKSTKSKSKKDANVSKSKNTKSMPVSNSIDNFFNDINHMSYESKTWVTIIFLFLLYPLGAVLMFYWMKWPMWVKILVLLPIIIPILILIMMTMFGFLIPVGIFGVILGTIFNGSL